ncbi:MAG: hypothetical protein SFY80_10270 [Verrucomicrobiota bacterium]|nr:hypothetical protein [Verrucomicrobiota bacterium]
MSVAAQFDPNEIFLAYQREYLSLCENAQVIIVEKSRRVGLSWADAADSCLTSAAAKSAGGMDCFYVGYNKDMAREYIEAVADWTRQFKQITAQIEEELIKDEDKDITVFRIRYASGFKVEALSSRPSNLRGKQGKVTIDEAAFHDDLRGLIKSALALIMWGGRVSIISTHFGEDNPFNEIVQDTRADRTGFKLMRITLQEALEQGLYRRICQVTGKVWSHEAEKAWADGLYKLYGTTATEELEVIPTGGTEVYLARVLIERAMTGGCPILRYRLENSFMLEAESRRMETIKRWCENNLRPIIAKLDPNLLHFGGVDFARSGDLTGIWILSQERDLRLRARTLIELRNLPFESQREIVFYLLDRIPRFTKILLDARGNGQYLAEACLLKYGSSRVEAVMFSQPWYMEYMPKVKAVFEDGTIFDLPKDADVMADLRSIKNIRGVPKVPDDARTKGSDGFDRHGDTAIGLSLAITAANQPFEIFDYESVKSPPRHRRNHDEDNRFSNPDWRSASSF